MAERVNWSPRSLRKSQGSWALPLLHVAFERPQFISMERLLG